LPGVTFEASLTPGFWRRKMTTTEKLLLDRSERLVRLEPEMREKDARIDPLEGQLYAASAAQAGREIHAPWRDYADD